MKSPDTTPTAASPTVASLAVDVVRATARSVIDTATAELGAARERLAKVRVKEAALTAAEAEVEAAAQRLRDADAALLSIDEEHQARLAAERLAERSELYDTNAARYEAARAALDASTAQIVHLAMAIEDRIDAVRAALVEVATTAAAANNVAAELGRPRLVPFVDAQRYQIAIAEGVLVAWRARGGGMGPHPRAWDWIRPL